MAYIAPIHQPSSIRHALKLNFLSPDEECLAIAKANRLEFYIHTPDGLSLQHSRSIYGRISMLNKLRPASSTTDHLFVGTDRFHYFTLSWNAQTKQIQTEKSYIDQADKSARDSQTGDRCHIDPSGKFMTLELYEGVITVLPISQKVKKQGDPEVGTLGEPIPIRIEELFVRDSTFFKARLREKEEKPRIALIYEDTQKRVRLKIRQLTYSPGLRDEPGTAELLVPEKGPEEGPQEDLEIGASHIIPLQSSTCGVLILGETSIMYYEYSSHTIIKRPLEEATIFTAWTQIDRQRFVLADEYGSLHMLMLELDVQERVASWRLEDFGTCSRASVLTYMGDGILFVGSHSGDSQLVRIGEGRIEVTQTLPNIAPILDFTIMDMGSRSGEGSTNEYSSGQARLVTGSGAFTDGSLRSVRSGVGLEDLGMLAQMDNINNIFSVKSENSSEYADTLIVSLIDDTRIFRFAADGNVEELDQFCGISLGEATLLATNVTNNRVLQVTSTTVRLLDVESGMLVADWDAPPSQSITAAAANDTTVILSIGGAALVALDTVDDLHVRSEKAFGADKQVACVSLSPAQSSICLVGFWQSSAVSILNLDNLEPLHTESVSESTVSVPRSLLLLNVLEDQPPTLFVAMADGNVVTYNMDPKTCALSGKRSTVLGTQQAGFTALPKGDGFYNVFATCDHSSLIYGSEGRLVYSAITAEDAICVCPFNAQAYPGAIAIATKEHLKLAVVDEERSTHVQGLHVGATVRRIAYSPELKAFGLGTITRELKGGVEIVKSSFQLVDEVVFKVLHTFELNQEELVESVMRCQLDDGYGNLAERFVVGTAYLDDEHTDSVRGRILIFEVTKDRQLKILTELAVKGACRCLAMVEGKIVAALIKTVVIYSFEYETPSSPFLRKVASYRTSTAPIDLAVEGNRIAIADLMKSVSVVEYKASYAGSSDTLKEVARHFQTTWGTAVALVEDHKFLEADAEGNLMVLSQDVTSEFAEDRRRLKITSELKLGEMVNRIRPITTLGAVADANAVVIPKAFLATVEGSIYLFALIAPTMQNLLMELQRALAARVQSPGHVPFMKYRAFKSQVREEEEPMRFVDGELIEAFLDVDEAAQQEMLQATGMAETFEVDRVRGIVEGLRRLR